MKASGAAFSSRCASRVSSLPCVSSSPIDSSPTRGESMPNATRAYTLPITANCSRCCGRHSTLAPTSSSTAGVPPRRNRRGERRPIDARQHAERRVRRHHRRAGVARR